MKSFLKYLFSIVLILSIGILLFYIWAKSPKLSTEEYNNEIEYEVKIPTINDSIIKIMSYNIGYLSGMTNNQSVRPTRDFYKKNEEEVVQLFKKIHPDIVGFQEIDFGSNRSYDINQHELIASKLYPYTVRAVNWDKTYVPFPYYPFNVHFGSMLSGQSIMSKFPLENSERIVLEEVKSSPFYYKAMYLDRLLQITTIKHPLADISFMNVHTEAFDQPTRKAQIEFVFTQFSELAKRGPVILVGDFNSDPSYDKSAILKYLDNLSIGLASIDNNHFGKSYYTYPSDSPKERLDYIFYTKKDFKLINSRVATSFGMISDHLPYIATLKIKK